MTRRGIRIAAGLGIFAIAFLSYSVVRQRTARIRRGDPPVRPGKHQIVPVAATVPRPAPPAGLVESPAPTPDLPLALNDVQVRGRSNFEETLHRARNLKDAETKDKALSMLCLCLCGLIETNIDIPRAIVLASEIQDPAMRLHAQGEIAVYWAKCRPEEALSWAQFLPENATPKFPPANERERISWYDFNSREKILMCCIQGWTAVSHDEKGIRVYPQAQVEAARFWIERASLDEGMKKRLMIMLPKP